MWPQIDVDGAGSDGRWTSIELTSPVHGSIANHVGHRLIVQLPYPTVRDWNLPVPMSVLFPSTLIRCFRQGEGLCAECCGRVQRPWRTVVRFRLTGMTAGRQPGIKYWSLAKIRS